MIHPPTPIDLDALLACPHCRSSLRHPLPSLFSCPDCGAQYPVEDGIPLLFSRSGLGGMDGVARLYDDIAEDYDAALPSHVSQHYLARRSALIGRLLPSGTVLDVGCGTGQLAGALVRRGFSMVGLDASLGMLRVMARRAAGRPVAGYGEALPFRDGCFDLAVSVAALHHIADAGRVAATIGEMCRVVRRAGAVLIWDHNPLNPYWPLIMRRVPQDSGEERLIPREELLEALQRAGMVEVKARRLGFTPDFVPGPLMPLWVSLETLAERLPLIREVAAHNVILAWKA